MVLLGSRPRLGARRRARLAQVVILAASFGSCGPRVDNSQVHLSPPVESTTVAAGDVFTMQIVGEHELPTMYQVDSNGDVRLPYIHSVHVDGLEPQQIAELVRKRLIEEKILSDPSIVIRVEQYRSKSLVILGQVSKPGRYVFTPGITLLQAVSLAGGFNSTAKSDRVLLTRKTKSGTHSVVLSVDAITEGRSPDLPLQAGDRIYVPQRIF